MVEKVFTTRMLLGNTVTVICKNGQRVAGTMLEFFERNNAIAIKDFVIFDKNENGEWECVEKGDLIILKGDAWAELICKKFAGKLGD